MSEPRIKRRMLNNQVYDIIRERIVDGLLSPGQHVNMDGLARELGVSNIPVREALARLAAERLIHLEPLKGYTIPPVLSAEQMAQLFETRLLIETFAARIGAIRRSSDTIQRMRVLINGMGEEQERLQAAAGEPSYHEFKVFNRLDRDFHTLLVASSGNAVLTDMYEYLSPHIHLSRFYALRGGVDAAEAVHEHLAILNAFDHQHAEAAVAALTAHLEGSQRRLSAGLKNPDGGSEDMVSA